MKKTIFVACLILTMACVSIAVLADTSLDADATLSADNSQIHVVEDGETLWQIARPIADKEGQDIREIMYKLQINNGLNDNCVLTPGQKIVIRY